MKTPFFILTYVILTYTAFINENLLFALIYSGISVYYLLKNE